MFRKLLDSTVTRAAVASVAVAAAGTSAACEEHKVHGDHTLVDVRKRLPTEPHFLHGLAWADGVSRPLFEG
jgi:hypothetical protein